MFWTCHLWATCQAVPMQVTDRPRNFGLELHAIGNWQQHKFCICIKVLQRQRLHTKGRTWPHMWNNHCDQMVTDTTMNVLKNTSESKIKVWVASVSNLTKLLAHKNDQQTKVSDSYHFTVCLANITSSHAMHLQNIWGAFINLYNRYQKFGAHIHDRHQNEYTSQVLAKYENCILCTLGHQNKIGYFILMP